MTMKSLIAAAIAAAFAIPLVAQAGDKASSGSSGGTSASQSSGSSGSATGASGSASSGKSGPAASGKSASGAEAMFKALDKNNDGFLTRDEVKGTPHEKDFAKLDKNGDGKLSREEHAAAPEHAGEKAATGGTTGGLTLSCTRA